MNKFKDTLITFSSLAIVLVITACASFATRVRDEAEIGKVKKVAVIAYTANLPAARTLSLDVGSGKVGGAAGGTIIPMNSVDTDKMYTEFIKSVEKTQGWKVLDQQTMIKHAAYVAAYKDTMEGWQNKMPAGQGTTDFNVASVMDWNGPRILKYEGREKLMKDLGVDALIMLKVSVQLKGMTVAGIGARKPQAQAHIEVYGKGVEKIIWFDSFEGDESSESVGMTGFINEKKLGELSLYSAQTAFAKMGSKVN